MKAGGELERLLSLRGIEKEFVDFHGQTRDVSADTLHRIVDALGHDSDDAATLASDAVAHIDKGWSRILSPVVVIRPHRHEDIEVTLCAPIPASLSWRLEMENGQVHEGELIPPEMKSFAERRVGTKHYYRFAFQLPAAPAPGYHTLILVGMDEEVLARTRLIVAPQYCWEPEKIARGENIWGIAVQLYSLRSSRNWGIGDFRDLKALVVAASRRGVDVIGLNPLHALFPSRPRLCSPYSPASRQFLNTLYIAPECIPEYEKCDLARKIVAGENFQATLEHLREAKFVDYEGVARCKEEILRLLFDEFEKDPFSERQTKFETYSRNRGQSLEKLAIYYAIDYQQCAAGRLAGWPNWDAEYQDPDSAAVTAFAERHDGDIRYYKYLQWITSQQLEAVESAARNAGMTIGCYRDLAVGVDGAGPDTWMDQALYVSGVNIGAPPDVLAADGQDWCMPPMNPQVMRERAYQPFIDLLRANMVEGGALRMDHVMALQRMWWVPEGLQASDGAYVKNHLNDLMAIVALESQRCHCLVVGEDLGTVPPEIRQSMRDIGMYSYKVIVFELDETGHCRKPDDYPTRSVVTLTTHDMPPIAGVWSGSDIKARQRIGLLADGKPAENAINVRRTEKERLVAALQRERLLEVQDVHHDEVMNRLRPKMMDAIQMYAARSSASLMLVRAEEWLGEEEPFNLPGTDQEYPNWRRKLDIDLVSFLNDPKCMQWCAQITGTRNRNESASSQS